MMGKKILVVEDEVAIADLLKSLLSRAGYDVAGSVRSGEEALAVVAGNRPDLLLMDINLAGEMDGIQTARVIATRFDLPVVFLTGMADDETIQRSLGSRAFGYLLKPFELEDLKASVDLAFSKHAVESGLRQVERRFAASIKSISDAVITTDSTGRITYMNPVAEAATGCSLNEALHCDLRTVLRLEEGDGMPSVLSEPCGETIRFESILISATGGRIPVECGSAMIRDEEHNALGQVITFRDISERTRANEQLRASREQLRQLASHLQNAREAERTSIAREVHDELGQLLTGLRMDLAWLDKAVVTWGPASGKEAVTRKLSGMFLLVDQMVKHVRRISAELRPGVLDDLGLIPAIEWQAREWQERTGVICDVTAECDGVELPGDQRTALFRIFQESLTNIARHSGATMVSARLSADHAAMHLVIADNGRGITASEIAQTNSFGLLGMRERAAMLNGQFEISPGPDGGTRVAVSIPIARPATGIAC